MALTRAIDTLYIKLSNTSNTFSQKLLEAAKGLEQVEIIEGSYEGPVVIEPEDEEGPPPF